MTVKTVSILGSTGSIGTSTLDLISGHSDAFRVVALSAGKNLERLTLQAKKFKPDFVAIADETQGAALREALSGTGIETGAGESAVLEAASRATDLSVAGIVGMAGLKPVLQSIQSSKAVAIANKEPLVAAGAFVLDAARKHGTKILPVDSEHNAVFQVFDQENRAAIRRIILTASGGPFRTWTKDQMETATPAQAIAHPNWSMGAKISVDSASMMNKALEVIEAHYLFDMPPEKIDVLIHPQSVIHSMVEYEDGSVLAQLGAPDMRTPIAHALAWPARMATTGERLDFTKMKDLTFEEPDLSRFPALRLAYECLTAGPAACIALNAANEVAVAEFLAGKIPFGGVVRTVENVVGQCDSGNVQSLDDVFTLDNRARQMAASLAKQQ
jgi:1-deoxy-D-xylulose-5-phosphate reductoisomerase